MYETFYDEVNRQEQRYTIKGDFYIHKPSESDLSKLGETDRLFIDVIDNHDPEFDQVFNDIFNRIKNPEENHSEFNLLFGGKLMNSSHRTMTQWLLKTIYATTNSKSRFIINEKLSHLKSIVDNFFTVSMNDDTESTKCCLKYTIIIDKNNVLEHLIITPDWYDPTFSYFKKDAFSVYKIFDLLFSTSKHSEQTYLTSELNQLKSVKHCLKAIGFSQTEIEELLETIYALIDLSKFNAQGNKKALDFYGMSHFKMAAQKLKISEQGLHDFLIEEYTWKNNKKQLNSAENINTNVRCFIIKLYEVLVTFIFDKFNGEPETDGSSLDSVKINFIHSCQIPLFKEKQMFFYGDFLQYAQSVNFHSKLSSLINEKVNVFAESTNTQIKCHHSNNLVQLIQTINDFVMKCKLEKNQFEFLKKSEKSFGNKIRFVKDGETSVLIFIDELEIYAKFDWQSFCDYSESFDEKRMKSLLKLSTGSIFRKCRITTSIDFTPIKSKSNQRLVLIPSFASNTVSIYTLIDDKFQSDPKFAFCKQITTGNLEYLSVEEICSKPISFEGFVSKFRDLFLHHNDTSTDFKAASKHAISLLKLDKAWCSENHIHLQTRHFERLEELKNNFLKTVITVQGYFRVLLSRIELRKLKMFAEKYRTIYDGSRKYVEEFSEDFRSIYKELCTLDLGHADGDLIDRIQPTLKMLEDFKSEDFQWLTIIVMNGTNVVATKSFENSKLCVGYTNAEALGISQYIDIRAVLPTNQSDISPFIMKISLTLSGDVVVEFRSTKTLSVWNMDSKINKDNLSLSSGVLYPEKEYRLFSMGYILRKIAYSVINRVPYNVTNLVKESSFAIIINEDVLYPRSISKAPLWLYFRNNYPICNLSSTVIFNAVEKEIREIDKNQCKRLIKGPATKPKDDWLTEDVYLQLMVISLEKEKRQCSFDEMDCVATSRKSDPRPSLMSNVDKHWSKINYKQRKYMFKNFN